jgi:succinate dehydrogenase / fumarate reductase flavoprotein subunit
MGGLWVDYNLMSNIKGLFVLGEANFSDHGANRLGASALMQGLADGYFIAPYTIGDYLAGVTPGNIDDTTKEFRQAKEEASHKINHLASLKGQRTVDDFHRELGGIMWEYCGMSRSAKGLQQALKAIVPLREEFYKQVNVPGSHSDLNQSLEKAGRVADFFEFAELMCTDALERKESCGGHFREEYQTNDGEARRDDENFRHVAAWEFRGLGKEPLMHKEPLEFTEVALTQRNYK